MYYGSKIFTLCTHLYNYTATMVDLFPNVNERTNFQLNFETILCVYLFFIVNMVSND